MHIEYEQPSAVWVLPNFMADPNGSEAIAVIPTSGDTWDLILVMTDEIKTLDRWELRPESDFKGAVAALDADFRRLGFVRLIDSSEAERALEIIRSMLGSN